MNPDAPFVSIIMPIRNEADFIARSLGAVLQQTYPSDRMEIIIVDGMSTDGTREIITSLAESTGHTVRLIDNPDLIVPAGLNRAFELSCGDIIVRVDGHCEIAPEYVDECVRLLQTTDYAGVGGPIETISESVTGTAIAAGMSSRFGVGDSAFRTSIERVADVDTIAFPAYKRSAMSNVGKYDEALVRNQDDEYNYRMRSMGYKLLLDPAIKSKYFSRSTIRRLAKQYYQYGVYKVRVMQKHPRQMRPRQFVPAAFVAGVIGGGVLSVFSKRLAAVWKLTLVAYSLANVIASLITASRHGWRQFPYLPVVFLTLHVSYGVGFWRGMLKFWNRWTDRA